MSKKIDYSKYGYSPDPWDDWDDDDAPDAKKDEKKGKRKWGWTWGGGSKDGSVSGWLTSRFGGVSSFFSGTSPDAARYAHALRTVRRLGRIVYGGSAFFSWLNDDLVSADPASARRSRTRRGEVKGEVKDAIVLDPTVLGNDGKYMGDSARVDVLVGGALAGAGAREYYGEYPTLGGRLTELTNGSKADSLHGAQLSLQRAGAWLLARDRVTDAYPGFTGYFDAERSFAHRDDARRAVLAGIAEVQSGDEVTAATLAAVWDTLCPEAPIDLSGIVRREVAETAKLVAEDLRAAGPVGRDEIVDSVERALVALEKLNVKHALDNIDAACTARGAMHLPGSGESENVSKHSARVESEAEDMVGRGYEQVVPSDLGIPSGMPGSDDGDRRDVLHVIDAERIAGSYRAALSGVRALVARTRASLAFRNERAIHDELSMRRGQVDDGGIHKLIEGDVRVFRRTEFVGAPRVHVGLLVDMSGSMGCATGRYEHHGATSRSALARSCAILIKEATRGLKGVKISIWGHTGDSKYSGIEIYRFVEAGRGDVDRMGYIDGYSQNYDGYAIGYCESRLRELSDNDESRVLFVLADGYPSGYGYGGSAAVEHVREVVQGGRRKGTELYCLGMGSGLDQIGLETMYGRGGYEIVPQERELPRALAKLLKGVLRTGRISA